LAPDTLKGLTKGGYGERVKIKQRSREKKSGGGCQRPERHGKGKSKRTSNRPGRLTKIEKNSRKKKRQRRKGYTPLLNAANFTPGQQPGSFWVEDETKKKGNVGTKNLNGKNGLPKEEGGGGKGSAGSIRPCDGPTS